MENPSSFVDILHQAEQLTAQMEAEPSVELPRVQRNLAQIISAGERLWNKSGKTTSSEPANVKAAILLGSKGVDIPRLSKNLENITAVKSLEPIEPVRETDVQGFLKNERENALLSAIEETKKHTFAEVEELHWENLRREWEREKEKILNTLAGGDDDLLFPAAGSMTALMDITVKSRSAMNAAEMAYSRQIYMYNEAIISGGVKPDIVSLFIEASKTMDNKNVEDLWKMIRHLSRVSGPPASMSVSAYRASKEFQTAFIANGKRYLEESYLEYVKSVVQSNLERSMVGGVPGTLQLIKGFLNIILPPNVAGLEDGRLDGQPVWAVIYYCLRCGDLQAAGAAVESARACLDQFYDFFQEYRRSKQCRLSLETENKLRLLYRRSLVTSTDPFKKAVYCVVGRCSAVDDHHEIADKIDDFLWLKLSLVECDPAVDTPETLGLAAFQTQLSEEFGEGHFKAAEQPFLYSQVLLLTAQLENTIEFLSRNDRLRPHAVHLALAFHELGLLVQTESVQAPLLQSDPTRPSLKRLNFARLIMMYTSKFELTDPREALQYFFHLRGLKTPQDTNLFENSISELVLETGEFEMLLGKMNSDGTRMPGAIDKYQVNTSKLIALVARNSEEKGLFEEAVLLHDLAHSHERVLQLLNSLIIQVLAQPSRPQSNRERVQTLAVALGKRYRSSGYCAGSTVAAAFYLLLDLMNFFDLYHSGSAEHALELLDQLHLIPLAHDQIEDRISRFSNYSDEIRRCLPEILLATMDILHSEYKKTKSVAPTQTSPLKDSFSQHLRQQAKALIAFAGTIPYRMPGDTIARLVQMEVMMN